MSWILHVTGECDDEREKELARAIRNLMSDPKYGTTGSQMFGNTINGPVHLRAAPKARTDGSASS